MEDATPLKRGDARILRLLSAPDSKQPPLCHNLLAMPPAVDFPPPRDWQTFEDPGSLAPHLEGPAAPRSSR